jgi:WhiB family redox-sensing transcriptional regulator
VVSGPLRRRPRPPEPGREQRPGFGVLLTEFPAAVPCRTHDPDLWFSDTPAGLELAKHLCGDCLLRAECLQAALVRQEPWGVWGGQIVEDGHVLARKRPRGRPRKDDQVPAELRCQSTVDSAA